MRLDEFTQDYDAAIGRVRRHWARLGFEPLGRTGIYALSPEHARPDLGEFYDRVSDFGPL